MRWFVLIFLSMTVASCTSPIATTDLTTRQIRVTTTVGMISDVAHNVGGERVQVTGLMGAGVDPHLYKPSVGDVAKLDQADIISYGGLELEGRMTDMLEKLGRRKPVFAVSESIPRNMLRHPPEFNGAYDPHIWFDVRLWQYAVREIRDQLIALDPHSRSIYERNAADYLRQLDQLDQYVRDQSATLPADRRVLITAHDAFGYFGDAYGFDVRGLQGLSTASEAGAADVQQLAQFIADRQIKAVFVESSVPQATIQAVQKAVQARGWNVAIGGELFSDAMGNAGTVEGTYIGMVRHNIDIIVGALR